MESTAKLIVALDLPDRRELLALARQLIGNVGMVKVGLEAFIAHGPDLVSEIREMGHEVFLDLKVHDIPRTAAAAAREADRLGASLLTLHAAGGAEMIKAAREAASESLKIVAVTVLTSFNESGFDEIGFRGDIGTAATGMAALAIENGADGVVCSALELDSLSGIGGLRVVPGVRPQGSPKGDQKRVVTPAEAINMGATWIVVGRPIVQSPDPVAAAAAIVNELERS